MTVLHHLRTIIGCDCDTLTAENVALRRRLHNLHRAHAALTAELRDACRCHTVGERIRRAHALEQARTLAAFDAAPAVRHHHDDDGEEITR